MGAEITSLMIFGRGAVQHTAVFPFGSMHFTKDIATGLRVSIPEANKIKHDWGCVASFLMDDDERAGNDRDPSLWQKRNTGTVERNTLRHYAAACDRAAPAYFTRSKFGSRAHFGRGFSDGRRIACTGISEIAEQVFDAPTRLGFVQPEYFGGLAEEVQKPEWAIACGLALGSMRSHVRDRGNGRIAEQYASRTNGLEIFGKNLVKLRCAD